MGANRTLRSSFGQKLRAELDRREWGVRTLAREMAVRGNTPDRVESLRRQLKRYLSETDPVRPTAATRRAVEDALDMERGELADDDEEPSPPMSLDEFLRQHVASLVASAMKAGIVA